MLLSRTNQTDGVTVVAVEEVRGIQTARIEVHAAGGARIRAEGRRRPVVAVRAGIVHRGTIPVVEVPVYSATNGVDSDTFVFPSALPM